MARGRDYHRRSDCRACHGARLHPFLSLGPTPLANSFLGSPSEFPAELTYPLDVYLCEECSLVQLLDVVDPEVMFREYLYVTGTSETIAEHNQRYARTLVEQWGVGAGDLVAEIGSNDGSLLGCFAPFDARTVGIEPARNIAEIARGRGIDTVTSFFCLEAARQVRDSHGPARAVLANNVVAHVDDIEDFLAGVHHLLRSDGVFVFEVPYLGWLVDRLEYDTIYHEHLCYFSITSLCGLLARSGFSIEKVDDVPVHGGSIRVYAIPQRGRADGGHAPEVLRQVEREGAMGLASPRRYESFAADVAQNRQALRAFLEKARDDGLTIAGYGAPAKGNTLLNYCGIGTDLLPFTVDRNPLKVGLFTPGMHIPVLEVSALCEHQPDLTLILAWNFAEEIVKQQREYMMRGGRFLVPIPEPRILEP